MNRRDLVPESDYLQSQPYNEPLGAEQTATTSETFAPSTRIDAATFGRAIARAVKEHPYSSNWALVGMAIEIATGEEVNDIEEVPELIDRLAAESEVA